MTFLWSLSFLAFASLATAAGLPPEYSPHAIDATTHIPHASHALRLATKVTRPKRDTLTDSCEASLGGLFNDTAYGVNATIGGQNFLLILDTGR